jgi:UDP-N-acetylmuramate dehydrogenase
MSIGSAVNSNLVWPCAALPLAPLSSRTTMRVGGQAEWLLEPATQEELRAALVAARERGMPVRVLGGGANLLVQDGVLPGVVIATERLDRLFRPTGAGEERPMDEGGAERMSGRVAPEARHVDPRLVAWCGASLPALVRAAGELGWSGLEGLVGVPGRAGGGVAMNAGGRWGELWDVVEEVRLLDREGNFHDLMRADCSPSYRNAHLGERLVVAVVLRLAPSTKLQVKAVARQYLLEKNASQPVTEPSSGCIFKNPDPEVSGGRSAGRLIDELGGKGLSVGAATVSARHANFIVNRGGASATQVFELIGRVQDHVAQRSGILLELEVQRWTVEEGG